jgi:hypothetical protein
LAKHETPTMLLSPSRVQTLGLALHRILDNGNKPMKEKRKEELFRKEYGSGSLDLAEMWFDLQSTDVPDAKLREQDKSEKGFKMFLAAHHFLWTYPKNAQVFANNFGICEKYARGEKLWGWIQRIAGLKQKKIVWDKTFSSKQTEIFIIMVDGTDMRIWEKNIQHYPLTKDSTHTNLENMPLLSMRSQLLSAARKLSG